MFEQLLRLKVSVEWLLIGTFKAITVEHGLNIKTNSPKWVRLSRERNPMIKILTCYALGYG